jgi:hypothetical protein
MIYTVHQIVQVIILKRMRWARHVVHMTEKINVYRMLVDKPAVKRQKGRPKCRREKIFNGFKKLDWMA